MSKNYHVEPSAWFEHCIVNERVAFLMNHNYHFFDTIFCILFEENTHFNSFSMLSNDLLFSLLNLLIDNTIEICRDVDSLSLHITQHVKAKVMLNVSTKRKQCLVYKLISSKSYKSIICYKTCDVGKTHSPMF